MNSVLILKKRFNELTGILTLYTPLFNERMTVLFLSVGRILIQSRVHDLLSVNEKAFSRKF